MDADIESNFVALTKRREDFPPYAELVDYIRSSSIPYGFPIRSDAIYFLANNMIDMIYIPVTSTPTPIPKIEPEALRLAIYQDIKTILAECFKELESSRRKVVSTNVVIIALGRIYSDLQINSFKLWGRRD